MSRAPQAEGQRRPQGVSFLSRSRWARQQEITLRVTYRGGAECWYLVKARGCRQVFPGHCALEDVMSRVYGER